LRKPKKNNADKIEVNLVVNRQLCKAQVPPRLLLVEYLRDYLGITSPKLACETANCGACTVLIKFFGQKKFIAVKSCTLFVVQCNSAEVITAEGLSRDGQLNPVQSAFIEERALQCGYCTPGFVMAAVGLLIMNKSPSDEYIKKELAGNLCRCGAYVGIINAIKKAAKNFSEERAF
jgi:carbon-monoxide dehydrogenase small subunit